MKRTHARKRPQKVAVALGAVLVTAGCATAPAQDASAPIERSSRFDGGIEQLLLYCGKLRDSGELVTAASICDRAHTIAPGDPRPLLMLGEIFTKMEQLPQAVAAYQMILEQTPRHIEARYLLGRTYIAMGRHDLALPELKFVLTQDSTDARAYNALGIANGMLGDQAAAREAFENGLKVAPGDIPLRNNLGLALVLSGQHAEGVAMLQAVAADPAANATTIRNLRLAESLAQAATNGQEVVTATPMDDAAAPAGAPQLASATTDIQISAAATPAAPAPQPHTVPPSVPTEPVSLIEALNPLSDNVQMAAVGAPVYLDSGPSSEELEVPEANAETDVDGGTLQSAGDVADESAAAASDESETNDISTANETSEPSAETTDGLSSESMPKPVLMSDAELPPGEEPAATGELSPYVTADANMAAPYMTTPGETQAASLGSEDAYSVQLAAYRSADRARDGWRQIRAKALDLLEHVEPVIRRSDLGADRGVYFRLRTRPSSKSIANQLCTALLSRGISCLTIKESPAATGEGNMPAAAKS